MVSTDSSSSSSEAESSSPSTGQASSLPSNTLHKKNLPSKNDVNISTTSTPSSSVKHALEIDLKEATKPFSKKIKAEKKPEAETAKKDQTESKSSGERRGKEKLVEGEKSAKKSGTIWSPKDELAYLKGLAAFCAKGNDLSKKRLAVFYDGIRGELDGEYSNDQLYNKNRGLKSRFVVLRDKVKAKDFSFKDGREETLYKMCCQVWGNGEEKELAIEDEKEVKICGGVSSKSRRVATADQHHIDGNSSGRDSDGMENGSSSSDLRELLHEVNNKMLDEFKRQMLEENEEIMDNIEYQMKKFVRAVVQGIRTDGNLESPSSWQALHSHKIKTLPWHSIWRHLV